VGFVENILQWQLQEIVLPGYIKKHPHVVVHAAFNKVIKI
jgi:hypothetical protein